MKLAPLTWLTVACLAISPLSAQIGQQMALANSPAYEAAARPLRNAPPRQYNFSRAVLSDVMRLMAEDAGIGFFGLPEGSGNGDQLVTFTLNASPFAALETLAKANGVSLIYDSGIWYLRPANDQELIGRIYEINYNAQELVTKNNQSTQSANSSSSIGAGSSGLNLQGAPDYFVTEPSRILEDIRKILDIPTTGSHAQFAPTASVDSVAQFSVAGLQGQPELVVRTPGSASSEDGAGQSKVIWNSDSNTLYVVASRQQHQWIEAYLASADRPQPMIAVEVKFIETSRDPSSDLGIDWNGVLGSNGLEVGLSENAGPINLNHIGGYSLPTAILSYSDLNLKLRAIYNDRKTRMVSYPRMVTLDNREVSFRSVVNQPVLGSTASASLGAGATETSTIEYLPIGTVINILPKRMAGNKILLNVSVTVSDIIGTEFINGNPFPIATSRVYTAPLTVQSGYTVAISGLDAARTDENETGVPFLGRLPVIGGAFKNRRQDRSRQHLMMLITPVALNTGTEGLTEKPITREPWKAHPPVHQPVDYGKVPVTEGRPRQSMRAEPIAEVPEFQESAESRKATRSFGKTEALREAAPVKMTERAPAASAEPNPVSNVSYPEPIAPTTGATILAARRPAFPAASPAPVRADTLPVSFQGPEPVMAPREAAKQISTTQPFPSTNASREESSSEQSAALSNEAPVQVESVPEKIEPLPAASALKENKPTEQSPVQKTTVAQKEEAKSAPEAASGEKDPRLSQIREAIERLGKDLRKVPEGEGRLSPDDAQLVLNVHEEAQKWLGEVEKVRGDKNKPMTGALGDAWWDLIHLKSQASKLSQRSPESLAVKTGE